VQVDPSSETLITDSAAFLVALPSDGLAIGPNFSMSPYGDWKIFFDNKFLFIFYFGSLHASNPLKLMLLANIDIKPRPGTHRPEICPVI
jgi:hypothetical protein